jgi:hypothetical protein
MEEEEKIHVGFFIFPHMIKTRAVYTCLSFGFGWKREIESTLHSQRCGWYPRPEMTARKTRSTRAQKKTESGSGLLSPPSSTGDKAGDRDAAGPSSTMISPPSEEDEDRRSKVS